MPQRSATAVDRLVRAGAIPFGLTSLPDMNVVDGLMHQISSHSEAFGAVHNPYDPTRIPGGSSGGNGAILAARIVPAALGLDTNGSIRCPSAFCGVAGLRPSTLTIENAIQGSHRKRYPDDGLVLPPARRLDTIGPMARTVSDVAFIDWLITGERAATVNLRSVRIAVPRPSFWEEDWVDPDVAEVIRQTFTKLRSAGCTLVEIDFNAEVRSVVGTIEQPTPAAVFAADGMNAPTPSRDTMEAWLRENAPDVTMERMYRGRPTPGGRRTLPSPSEQIAALKVAAARYADVYQTRRVSAITYPTIPIVAPPIRPGGPKEPLGELITVNGKQYRGRQARRAEPIHRAAPWRPPRSVSRLVSRGGCRWGSSSMRSPARTPNSSAWAPQWRRRLGSFRHRVLYPVAAQTRLGKNVRLHHRPLFHEVFVDDVRVGNAGDSTYSGHRTAHHAAGVGTIP